MILRRYKPEDLPQITKLFYDTVHTVNAEDYSEDQLNVWAGVIDAEHWNASLLSHYSLVAVKGDTILGFGDIDHTGYLDRLYVHKDYQGQGIVSALYNKLEAFPDTEKLTVHASITARPFFEKRGYVVVKEQQVCRQGIYLINYSVVKSLSPKPSDK